MTNVAHYMLSGGFSEPILDKIVFVPAFEFAFNPYHSPRSMVPITTFTFPNLGRRQRFWEMMSERNVTVTNKNGVHGPELKKPFDEHAILVNVHQTEEHHTLEEFRILPALLRGMVIISEVSPLIEYVPYSLRLLGRRLCVIFDFIPLPAVSVWCLCDCLFSSL